MARINTGPHTILTDEQAKAQAAELLGRVTHKVKTPVHNIAFDLYTQEELWAISAAVHIELGRR